MCLGDCQVAWTVNDLTKASIQVYRTKHSCNTLHVKLKSEGGRDSSQIESHRNRNSVSIGGMGRSKLELSKLHPVSRSPPTACFCMTCKLRMVFLLSND